MNHYQLTRVMNRPVRMFDILTGRGQEGKEGIEDAGMLGESGILGISRIPLAGARPAAATLEKWKEGEMERGKQEKGEEGRMG